MVTQSNLGGSLRTAFEQIIGSLLGAVFAVAVAIAIRPEEAAIAATLVIALALRGAPSSPMLIERYPAARGLTAVSARGGIC